MAKPSRDFDELVEFAEKPPSVGIVSPQEKPKANKHESVDAPSPISPVIHGVSSSSLRTQVKQLLLDVPEHPFLNGVKRKECLDVSHVVHLLPALEEALNRYLSLPQTTANNQITIFNEALRRFLRQEAERHEKMLSI